MDCAYTGATQSQSFDPSRSRLHWSSGLAICTIGLTLIRGATDAIELTSLPMAINRVQGVDLFTNRNRVYEGTTDVMNACAYLSQFIAKGRDRNSIASAVPFAPDLPPWHVATDPSIPLGYMKYVHALVG